MVWEKRDIPQDAVKELAAKFGCDALMASILLRRGVAAGEEVLYYLEDDKRYLHNPFLLPGMEDAVERILAAKEEGEKVLVFGDRDVDGITSTALLTSYLRGMGLEARWRIPQGDEAYGLSAEAVEAAAHDDVTLIITVDCGISNLAEVDRANELGIDVVITDHQLRKNRINPKNRQRWIFLHLIFSSFTPFVPKHDRAKNTAAKSFVHKTDVNKPVVRLKLIRILSTTPILTPQSTMYR